MAKKSKKLEEIHTLFLEHDISAETIEQTDEIIFELKKRAEKDPRHQSYIRHLLVDIIMIVFFAVLGNANEWGGN